MILVGHITSTHAIKGELKVYSDFSLSDKVFCPSQKIWINKKEHEITSSRYHKNHYFKKQPKDLRILLFYLLDLKGLSNIMNSLKPLK